MNVRTHFDYNNYIAFMKTPTKIDTPHIKASVTVPKIFHVFIGWGLAAIDQFPTVSLVLENLTCNKNQHKERNVL